MASLGELLSGVLPKPRMNFHTSGLSPFDRELCRKSLQLLVLASLIATFTSQQASIHSCCFWWMVRYRRLRLRIFTWTCGLIQGFGVLLRLMLPTWFEAGDMRMLLSFEIRIESYRLLQIEIRIVKLFWELLHSWLTPVSKRGPVNAIVASPALPWND